MNKSWRDHGLIVDLELINLQNSTNFDWAQGPQIIDMETHFRLYFSSRVSDQEMQPISKVFFLDFSNDFKKILCEIKEVKIQDGLLGGFDQHGIFPFHPYEVDKKFLMALTTGWKRMKHVDIDMSIGQAISLDGEHFARNGHGPIISSSPSEPFLIGDPFVLKTNENYSLYYIFGTDWTNFESNPERTYKIGKIKSEDGFTFSRIFDGRQIVPDTIENEAQAMPTVVRINETYHMFYCYRSSFDFRGGGRNGYKLGHAVSRDDEVWELCHEDLPSKFPDWCQNMQCYPHARIIGNELYLFFNGDKFGKKGIGLMTRDIGAFDDTKFQ